ncbi:LexA family transcriptional regulator [Halotalea alkalilenta]|uniref:LexA family transcriptional regulator n=1 Tax=Halotalea alkalilenta TaxID=376489 RepID=UPI0012DD4568|nr:LexA family transcriptional regulator [Halotalea alkalilenta]
MSESEQPEQHQPDDEIAAGFPERIAIVIDHFKTKSAAAKIAGVDANTIGRWTERAATPNPKLRNLVPLLKRTGISMDWLISGEGARYLRPPQETREPSADYVLVPLHPASSDHQSPAHLPVTSEELTLRHLELKRLAAFVIEEDAMQPLLERGDMVLVDLTRTTPSSAGIHMVKFKGELLARRLQRTMNGLTLVCEDPSLENVAVPEDSLDALTVLGKIVWTGRWV